MIDLVLHPGHSKCGSTTIQDFLFDNRETLKSRGIFLPDANFNFPFNDEYNFNLTHTPRDYLARIQTGELPISDLETKLDALIQSAIQFGCRRVVISAENLINGISSQLTQSIHRLFAEKFNNVRIVYYIRRQDSLLISAWQQWGHKSGISLPDYIHKMSKTKFGDFLFIVKQLRKLYPEQVVKVFPLSKQHLRKENLLIDFCFRAQIDQNKLKFDIKSSNSGLSSAVCDSLSKISTIYPNDHDQQIKNHITELTSNSKNIREKKYRSDLSVELREFLVERFQDSNETLAKRFFPKVPFDSVMSLLPLVKDSPDELDILKEKITKLEDICSLQMDMILSLKKEIDNEC